MTLRRLTLLTPLLLLIAGLGVWLWSHGPETRRPAENAGVAIPDYYLEGVTAVRMGPDGRPVERLTSERVVHYADQPVMDAARPHLVIYRPAEGVPWQLDAATARLFEARNEIELAGGVTLYREGEQPLRLVTDTMLVDTAKKTAATDDPLTIIEPRARMDGVGMRAWLDEQRFELKSAVRGDYAHTR